MSVDIKLLHEYREEGHYFRAVEVRVGSGKSLELLPAWDDGLRLPAQLPPGWTPFVEKYARVPLSVLREAREDASKQAVLLKKYFEPSSEHPGLTVTKILVGPDEKVSEKDIDYLAHLFPLPGSILPVVPLLYRYVVGRSGRPRELGPVDAASYLAFASDLTKRLRGAGNDEFALAMPSNFSFSNVPPLLKLHKSDSTPLAVIDCNGRGTEELITQIRVVIGSTKKDAYSLTQKHGQKFALYAFDMKPFRGRPEIVPALNLLHLDGGFSSFGRRRTIRIGGGDEDRPRAPPKPSQTRVFFPQELSYARASVPEAMKHLKAWHKENRSAPHDDLERTLRSAKEYEHEQLAVTGKRMSSWARSNELHKKLDGLQHIRQAVRARQRQNARLLSNQVQKTLD